MRFEIVSEGLSVQSEGDRKLTRVGGSVMVALPKVVRRSVGLGVGDRVKVWAVGDEYIIIQKQKGARGGDISLRD